MRLLIAAFLIAHGVLHLLIWGTPPRDDAPFDAHKSPAFGDVRVASTVLATAAGIAFIMAGIVYLTGDHWWAVAAIAGAALSTAVILLTFTPWWLFALAINVAILVLTLRSQVAGGDP
jgi:hypothetical protein